MKAFLIFAIIKIILMKKIICAIVFFSFSLGLLAQDKEKIRGNRDVVVTQTKVDDFSVLEIGEDLKVTLVKGPIANVEIETDENLQEVFRKEVKNDTLKIFTSKDIRRSKKERIRIVVTDKLNKIIVKDDAFVESLTNLNFQNLKIITRNNSKLKASITAETFELKNNGESEVELKLTANEAKLQLNNSTEIEAVVQADNLQVDTYESAEGVINGNATVFTLRADNSSKIDAKNLIVQEATVLAEGRSENAINVQKDFKISARGTSKTNIYGKPTINLEAFEDEAVLQKKEK